MRESEFQAKLIRELKERFKGCIVMKNDSSYIQGIPDLLILHNDKWAALECKKDMKAMRSKSKHEPNQDHYVEKMNNMSFASFICPENKEEILNAIQQTFKS